VAQDGQAGLALFGVSVVAQGVQWTMNAWQTQDWVALGGCAAGALIVGAGVGSVATEWRRLWRLRQRAHERDEARDLLHSHGSEKGAHFVKSWRSRRARSVASGAAALVCRDP
jgi:putative membrane protein